MRIKHHALLSGWLIARGDTHCCLVASINGNVEHVGWNVHVVPSMHRRAMLRSLVSVPASTSTGCLARGRVSLSHLALLRCKGHQNLRLLSSGHLEEVECSPKFSRDFIELRRGNLEFAMGDF